MKINSVAYRVLTLSSVAGFLVMTLKLAAPSMSESDTLPWSYQVGRTVGGVLIPAFLLWRNIATLKTRQFLIPAPLMAASPWYFKVTMFSVWLTLVVKFALPAAAVFVGYSALENSVAAALSLGNLAAAGLWLEAPTLFFMELQCARYSGRPNNATCEGSRA